MYSRNNWYFQQYFNYIVYCGGQFFLICGGNWGLLCTLKSLANIITSGCTDYISSWAGISLVVIGLGVMVLSATFNNISVISWRSVLFVEETRVPGENHRPATSQWQTLSHNFVSSTPSWTVFELATLVVKGTDCIGSCKSNYNTTMTMTALDISTQANIDMLYCCFLPASIMELPREPYGRNK